MRHLSFVACSLLAIAVAAAPAPKQADKVELSNPSRYTTNVERDVDVSIDGKPIHLEGGYIRNTDLNRLGWAVGDRDSPQTRDMDVNGPATRQGLSYVKRGEEGAPEDVDGYSTRSNWGYIKRDEEGAPEDVDGYSTRSNWGYIKRGEEGAPEDVDGYSTRSNWGYIKRGEEGAPEDV